MNPKLYVGNLSYETSEADIRAAFEPFGTVTEVHLASDRYTGRPRGFAFVTFETDAEAKTAAEKLNGTQLGGRAIAVNEAKSPDGGGGGGGAGGAGARQFSSPNRRAGAFRERGKRRH